MQYTPPHKTLAFHSKVEQHVQNIQNGFVIEAGVGLIELSERNRVVMELSFCNILSALLFSPRPWIMVNLLYGLEGCNISFCTSIDRSGSSAQRKPWKYNTYLDNSTSRSKSLLCNSTQSLYEVDL
ncbi:hypothetical protein VNO77_37888 [Canavalia gladiata]|uniref:Uncharacterized protein n=1 Tax=Canavalia gladiata TaxID=3824 RepID=A0AAN9PXB4_CANGL